MAEEYVGARFRTIFIKQGILLDDKIKYLKFWGKKLALLGLTPEYESGAAGNLSFKSDDGYIITASGANLGKLRDDDFVKVIACGKDDVKVVGTKEPSSEAMLHCAIYGRRSDVHVIFHVHDDYAVKNCEKHGLKCTVNEQPYGTQELVDEVLEVMGDHDYIVMKNHGIISLGNSFDEAGDKILQINEKVKEDQSP